MGWNQMVVGARRRVRVWDAGSGTPVLFLHSFDAHPGDAPFLARLAEGRRVVAPEHPGYGSSDGAEQVDDILDMVLHYRQLIEELGGGPVDVVGHSLGGMFAAELAAICPQVVRRLALVSPFGLWLEETEVPDPFTLNEQDLLRATWAEPALKTASTSANGSNGSTAIEAALQRASNLSMATKFLWPIPDLGLSKRLELIRASTLVVSGEGDQLVPPAYGEAFAKRIRGATHEVIANAGHYPMLERPTEFTALVAEFLA